MPYEVVPGGLGGVEEGLRRLKEGKVSASKLVFRIEETEGVER
jgi:NADPH2:quinone reductase